MEATTAQGLFNQGATPGAVYLTVILQPKNWSGADALFKVGRSLTTVFFTWYSPWLIYTFMRMIVQDCGITLSQERYPSIAGESLTFNMYVIMDCLRCVSPPGSNSDRGVKIELLERLVESRSSMHKEAWVTSKAGGKVPVVQWASAKTTDYYNIILLYRGDYALLPWEKFVQGSPASTNRPP